MDKFLILFLASSAVGQPPDVPLELPPAIPAAGSPFPGGPGPMHVDPLTGGPMPGGPVPGGPMSGGPIGGPLPGDPLIDVAHPVFGPETAPPVDPADAGLGGHVPLSECRALIDIVINIDSSDSIYATDFEKLRNALVAMIPNLDLGPRRMKVGWVVFSTSIAEVQHLSFDKAALIARARKLIHARDGTRTDLAIARMMQEFKDNGRSGIPQVGITISDGKSKYNDKTVRQANLAKKRGISMFAIGIGLQDDTELVAMANSKRQVISLTSFDTLAQELQKLTKVICPCPELPVLPVIIIEPGDRTIGTVRNLTCPAGLQPVGKPFIKCRKDATWSRLKFACKFCPKPDPYHGNAVIKAKGPFVLGDTIQYICYDGHVIPKPITITCMPGPHGPEWTKPVGECRVCDPPRKSPWMSVNPDGKQLVGSVRIYTCISGLVQTGPIEIICRDVDGIPIWTDPVNICKGCLRPPPQIGEAMMVDHIYPKDMLILPDGAAYLGEERYYKCRHGYVETGTIKIKCMVDMGVTSWSIPKHGCTACLNEPPDIPNARLIKPGGQLIGDVRIYKCMQGFMALGEIETVCEAVKGQVGWRVPPFACMGCKLPKGVPNAIEDVSSGQDTRIGTVKRYICIDGFIQTGPLTIGCIEGPGGPIWTPPDFICTTCPAPPMVDNAVMDLEFGDNRVGGVRRYTCDKGLLPRGHGKVTVQCIGEMIKENGRAFWGRPSHICRGCLDPPPIQNARIVGGSNLIGDFMVYECIEPFKALGPVERKCRPTGDWGEPEFTCSACGKTVRVPHATIEPGPPSIGSIRLYKCHKGYTNIGDLEVICMENATWSRINFECVRCLEPPVYTNAVLEPGSIDIHAIRRYTCLPGYLETGPISTTCTGPRKANARPGWSKPVHYCKDCGKPYDVDFADLLPGPRTIGTLQRYECRKGFVPSGPPHSMCQPNAEWYPPNFKCIVCDEPPPTLLQASLVPIVIQDPLLDPYIGRKVGDIRIYECLKGYLQTGTIELLCTVKSTGKYPIPMWKELYQGDNCKACTGAPSIPLAIGVLPANGVTLIGEAVIYNCEPGYLQGGPMKAVCREDLTWLISESTCQACTGAPPIPLAIGVLPANGVTLINEAVIYKCEPGYLQGGPMKAICREDLTWLISESTCQACTGAPPIPLAIGVLPANGVTLIGEAVIYNCEPGYLQGGPMKAICREDLTWLISESTCQACTGAPPIPLAIGVLPANGVTLINEAVIYKCEPGYLQGGPMKAICREDLTWLISESTCKACTGAPPIPLAIGVLPANGVTLIGEAVIYNCEPGYLQGGPMQAICREDLTWLISESTCQACTGAPPIPLAIGVLPANGVTLINEAVIYKCEPGYLQGGPMKAICREDLTWLISESTCQACTGAPSIPLAIGVLPVNGVTLIGEAVIYNCEPGYLQGGPMKAICREDLTWLISESTCQACTGAPPIPLAIGVLPANGVTLINEAVIYNCEPGYLQGGPMKAICREDLTWLISESTCQACTGAPPIPLAIGVLPANGVTLINEAVIYKCEPGYLQGGPMKAICREDLTWLISESTCQACTGAPPIPLAIGMLPANGVTLINEAVIYKCEPGYLQGGPMKAICREDLTWLVSESTCKACVGAPDLALAIPIIPANGVTLIGAAVIYNCKPEYVQTAEITAVCQKDLSWKVSEVYCRGCEVPPSVVFASHVPPPTNIIGSVMEYICDQGYEPVGINKVHCLNTGDWSAPDFHCEIACYGKPSYVNAEIAAVSGKLLKDTITFACRTGYLLKGNNTVFCQMDGQWSQRLFTCETCVGAPDILEAIPVLPADGITLIGNAVTYTCRPEYFQTGEITALCQNDLSWFLSPIFCRGCETPPVVVLASPVPPPTNLIGSTMDYVCDTGYEPVGINKVQCMKTGEWSAPDFYCEVACYDNPSYINAEIAAISGKLLKDTITFACRTGYLLKGNNTVFCQMDGQWSQKLFTCDTCVGAPDILEAIPVLPADGITLIGNAVTYNCRPEYFQTGEITAVCQHDLSWFLSPIFCRGCETPPVVVLASPVPPPSNLIGSTMEYICNTGYEPVGINKVQCLTTGEWSSPDFYCEVACYDNPSYVNAEIAAVSGKLLKDTITFACKTGYLLKGNNTVFCQMDGQWSQRLFTCETCVGAPKIAEAIPILPADGITLIGAAVIYNCRPEYIQTGEITAVCQRDLSWKISEIFCRGCEVPPVVTFGKHPPLLTNIIGSVIEYACIKGYEPVGDTKVICESNGEWSKPKFFCTVACYDKPVYDDALVQGSDGYLLNNVITFKCRKGYRLDGDPTVVCQDSGLWSARNFTCRACFGAPKLPFALPFGPVEVLTLIGEVRTYGCENGYYKEGEIKVTCRDDLTWTLPKGRCRGCEVPPPVAFGKPIPPLTNIIGSAMEYNCTKGYEAVGEARVYCGKNGEWSMPNFHCAIACYDKPIYDDALIEGTSGYLLNNVITFKCRKGYRLDGDPNVFCQDTGLWSARKFTCRACFGAPKLPFALPFGPVEVLTLIGEVRTYGCENGYIKEGEVKVTCRDDLTWTLPKGRCRGCEYKPRVINGIALPPPINKIGSIMKYQCILNHRPTGKPVVKCMENGQWSDPAFKCLVSCSEPPKFHDAILKHVSGSTLNAMATYECRPEYTLTGNHHLFCKEGGHWSKRLFSCQTLECPPPPQWETAYPKTPGPVAVGSVIEYICRDGYISHGRVFSECLSTLEWDMHPEKCFDCGKPDVILNTYCSMGTNRIGSKRRYYCNYGYIMRGSGIIECLRTGRWSQVQFSCEVITTTTTTTPAPIPSKPSVCDRCRMKHNVGFMSHPDDCTQFVQCYYGGSGEIVAVYQHCPFGSYWSQHELTCRSAKHVDCPKERCLNRRIRHYKHSDKAKCCAYWECVNGKSVAKCCNDGYSYVEHKGCAPDPTCSIKHCPYEEMFPGCDKRPTTELAAFEQYTGLGNWAFMSCAPSTAFNMLDCRCSQHTWVDPGFDCRPELHMDFDDGQIIDLSGNHLPIYMENVVPYRGAAYFNGQSKLLINRFSNTAFHGHLVIKFRYKEDLRGSTAGALQALITNGDCGEDPSIIVAKMMGYVLLGSKTGKTKTFAMPVVDTEWKEVTYMHDEEQLEGRVCGASYSKYSYGAIRATHCGIQVGYGQRMANFMGLIDDFTIYMCRPPRNVLTSSMYYDS